VDPDVALIAAAVAQEQSLLLAYDEALVEHPELAAQLTPLRDEHAQHLARLQPTVPTPTPTPTVASSAATTRELPSTRRAKLAALERNAAAAHGTAALTASRRLAPVLASLSACEASHAVVL